MTSSGKRRSKATDAPSPAARSRRRRALAFALGAIALLAIGLGAAWQLRMAPAPAPLAFVGGAACVSCHAAEATAWRGSDHDSAMKPAADSTVLGDFADARFAKDGVVTRFFRRDGKFIVNTDGPDGALADFEIRYAFGVRPLQQYLIEFPDGRLQALSIAWDSRPRDAGGQRWFHLYADERIPAADPLHWTKPAQNWNFMCAECHSTGLERRYDAARDRFDTRWSEINVGCEACHGAGSRHVAWAARATGWLGFLAPRDATMGFEARFDERRGATWTVDPAGGSAKRAPAPAAPKELEACGRCHSRRAPIAEDWRPGVSLADTHLVARLDAGLYHADGQILDEVYEYGSFRQSLMFMRGVTCSDCHEPHALKLRADGDALCAGCHAPAKFAAPAHHLHAAGGAPRCVDCHMPTRTYMQVDARRDHSFRVPRPDLSARLGTPNACATCHADRGDAWAADAIARAHGPTRKGLQNWGEAFHAARAGLPEGRALLHAVLADAATPGIARATAYAALADYPGPDALAALGRGLADPDPVVRLGALAALESVPPDQRWALASRLLDDPVRGVRIQAAARLAATPAARLAASDRARLDRAGAEFVAAQRLFADRPEARINLANFLAARGQPAEAESEYRAAIRLAPGAAAGYVNLADLYRAMAREADGEATLRAGLARIPDDAALHHALGLALTRQRRGAEALAEFERAAALAPDSARYAYVRAVALDAAGRRDEASRILEATLARHPGDRDALAALTAWARERGDFDAALRYAEQLARLLPPGDPAAQRMLDELRARRR